MNAVFGSILENLQQIDIIYTPTIEVFRKDKSSTGDAREFTVNEFISRYLPSDYIVKKAKIYSLTNESNSIDCVVLAPNHPQLITPKREVVLAEGVYAAVEVKPDISALSEKSEFLRSLGQVKSIKNLEREIEQIDMSSLTAARPRPDYYKKIPAILFSSKSAEAKETIEFMISKVQDGTFTTEELPDIIVTLDHGLIFYTPHFSYSSVGKMFAPELVELCGENTFIHFETTEKAVTLVLFLLFFLNLTPPTFLNHKFILIKYLGNIQANFKKTPYPLKPNIEKAAEMVQKMLKTLADNYNGQSHNI